MRGGILRHLLGLGLYTDFGGEHPETSYRPRRQRQLHPYQCPVEECQGIKRARRAPICLGVGAWHSDTAMRITDDDAPPDTPGLETR